MAEISICDECGSLVANTEAHDQFHEYFNMIQAQVNYIDPNFQDQDI